MRTLAIFSILVMGLGLTAMAMAETTVWDGERPTPSVPYSFNPQGLDNPTNVAIFRDQLPWGSDADDMVLTNNAIAFTVYSGADIGNVDISGFDKVILSNQQPATFINTVVANAAWFEDYVAAGGCLLNGMAHYFSDCPVGTTYPGGFTYTAQEGNNNVVIVNPAHAVFTSPNPVTVADLNGWSYSTHGDIDVPAGGSILLQNADLTQGPALVEAPFGTGYIVATTQPYNWVGASNPFTENLVLYNPCGSVATDARNWGTIKSLFR